MALRAVVLGALALVVPGLACPKFGVDVLSAGLRSVEVLEHDEPLYFLPGPGAARRGAAARNAHLPVYEAVRAPGCDRRWLLVGPQAWVCETRVLPSERPPLPASDDHASDDHALAADALPCRYFFVGPAGTVGYRSWSDIGEPVPDAEYEPGFALCVIATAEREPDGPYGLTPKGLWVRMQDLIAIPPVLFRGEKLGPSCGTVAWAYEDQVPLYRSPAGARVVGATLDRFEKVTVVESRMRSGQQWLRIGPDRWLRATQVRRMTRSEPPPDLEPQERWIDVDLEQQVLTAYQGQEPVFATLVSTGKGPRGSESSTPVGQYRIWAKLRTCDMDNLEDEEARRYYSMQDVPWVMYFYRGYGLHGTFWHQSFGRKRSHGCVNLAPWDAWWLFFWTSPRLPAGWSAVLPSQYDPGTRVRIR